MKKITSLLLAISILFTLFVINGCKKGENDPFFSIRSRKARVAGDWTVSNFSRNVDYTSSGGDINETKKFTINGTSCSQTSVERITPGDTTITHSGTVKTATYTFEKNGEMNVVLDYTLNWDDWGGPIDTLGDQTTTTTNTENKITEIKGTWDFLSGVDEYKNKERLTFVTEYEKETVNETIKKILTDKDDIVTVLIPTTTTSTNDVYEYANGECTEVWAITQLKDKEMLLERTINTITTNTDGYWIKATGTETMTLTQGEDEE